MTMTAPPAKTAISDVYPNPTNAVARTGFGALWDYVTGLLGSTGFTAGMLSASKILEPQALYNVSLVPSVAGNALTMKLTSADGSTALAAGNPATVSQRSSTLASGIYNVRNITADITTVISSGSTAGHSNAVAGYLYWYLIDNAGTQELAWSSKDYGREGIVSTTAEGGAGAADSATTMYSTTARSNLPFRLVGRTIDTQATAGTWTAVPTSIELLPAPVFTDGQVAFPATQNPSSDANVLDDYEEGAWTPSIQWGGASTGQTAAVQLGTYVKIGKLVYASFSLVLTAKGSSTGLVSAVAGLPFAAGGAGSVIYLSGPLQFSNMANNYVSMYLTLVSGASVASVIAQAAAAANSGNSIADTAWNNNSTLYGTIVYVAAN